MTRRRIEIGGRALRRLPCPVAGVALYGTRIGAFAFIYSEDQSLIGAPRYAASVSDGASPRPRYLAAGPDPAPVRAALIAAMDAAETLT